MPLDPPPRDASGAVVPHDHSGIGDEDGLIRRISEQQLAEDKDGNPMVSSVAFKPSSGSNGGLSVDLEAQILEAGHDTYEYVTTPRWLGSLRFVAGDLRGEGHQVGYDPLTENPHHGEVWGVDSRAKRHRLRDLATWYVPIDGVKL